MRLFRSLATLVLGVQQFKGPLLVILIEQIDTIFLQHLQNRGVRNVRVMPHIALHTVCRVVLIHGHLMRQIKMPGYILFMGDRHGVNALVILKPDLFPGYRVEIQESFAHRKAGPKPRPFITTR